MAVDNRHGRSKPDAIAHQNGYTKAAKSAAVGKVAGWRSQNDKVASETVGDEDPVRDAILADATVALAVPPSSCVEPRANVLADPENRE
jgi:hypothetical protein